MTPLIVTARLRNGIERKDPWSPSLDGILAAALMRSILSPEDYAAQAASPSSLRPVEGLPLERVEAGGDWWWAASMPFPSGAAGHATSHIHRRFDDHAERYLPADTKRVPTGAGPYKAGRIEVTRLLCRAMSWHVVGDETEIRRLLSGIRQIGGRRGIGAGEVASWDIASGGDSEIARWRRPVPLLAARARGLEGVEITWGIRPPAHAPVNRTLCLAPAEA